MNAIFFDFDGTLFDTRADLAATVNHTRRDLGLREQSLETVVKHVGQGARYLLINSIPEAAGRPFGELWGIFKGHYAEHCCETLVPYEGVLDTLQALKKGGWSLGIVTNKPNFAVSLILKKFALADLFGAAVVAGGDTTEMKPSAAPLVACAAKMGHIPDCRDWMVGDSWTDLTCAANAGVKSAFCTFGFGYRRDAKYTAAIDRFSDLKRICHVV